jgi:hypothetical protein
LQVARVAELARQNPSDKAALENLFATIGITSQASFQLIDGYLLSASVQAGQVSLGLEPVSMPGVLYDVAHSLDRYAAAAGCRIELNADGAFTPVMANQRGIEAAYMNMGFNFIEAVAAQPDEIRTVRFVVQRTRQGGVSAGLFSAAPGLSRALLQRGRALYGYARQPLNEFMASASAGVFVADTLLRGMDAVLDVSRHRRQTGLSAGFPPSKQLALV